jgi:hypothetical protein
MIKKLLNVHRKFKLTGTSRRRQEVRKGCGRVNMVQILCTHICKGKTRPVETVPGMKGRGLEENDGGGEFKYDIFDVLSELSLM